MVKSLHTEEVESNINFFWGEVQVVLIIAERHEKDARDLFVDCTRQLEETKTKIERLQTRNDELNILNKTAAQEAIKEFAERLKEIIYTHMDRVDVDGVVLLTRIDNSIDNLVKEMTKGE